MAIFVVERPGGIDIPAGLEHGARVIAVPWAYGASCRPVPWPASARFIPAGESHFFQATLRDSSAWINGLPTVDVGGREPASTAQTWSGRDADQVFDLFEQLPSQAELDRDGWGALARVTRWAAEQPEAAKRQAVRGMLLNLAYAAEVQRLASAALPMRGTWSARVELPSGRTVEFWIRTASSPLYPRASFQGLQAPEEQDPLAFRASGYSIAFWAAADQEDLPSPNVPAFAISNWPVEVSMKDSLAGNARVWRAMFEIGSATWPPEIDEEATEFFVRYADLKQEQAKAAGWVYTPLPGRLTEARDGSVTFEQELELGPRVVIRARRMSPDAVAGNGYYKP
jgi:hypothetical protein